MSDYSNTSAGKKIVQYPTISPVPPQMINMGLQQPQAGNTYRFGGLLTYEKPIVEFPGDINIAASSSVLLRAGEELPRNCVGIRFINLIPTVLISVNGFPFRTVLNNDVFSGCEIRSLQVVTDAAGSVTVQAVGTGD